MNMKAVVFTEFGSPDVLRLAEIAKPVPGDHEVLVRIHAASINFGDTLTRKFNSVGPRSFSMPGILWLPSRLAMGIRKPRKHVLGSEFAGQIEAVGKAVTRFKPGDRVFGYRGFQMGANAEYLCMPADGLIAPKPANLSDEEAATIPYGALTALSLLRRMKVQPGQKVLVNGASGGIGAAAVQLAKHFGAEVTGVCSTPRLAYVRALGADHVIDYTGEDFTQNGETYDLIVDVPGKLTFGQCKRALRHGGRLLYVSFKMRQVWQMLWTARLSRRKVVCALSSEKLDDLLFIKELVEAGALTAIVDRAYPLEQAADAHRYIENGGKKGSVVLKLA